MNVDDSALGIDNDENDGLLPDNEEKEQEDLIKEKDHARKTLILSTNDYQNMKEKRDLGAVNKNTFANYEKTNQKENIISYNISKYMDIQQCMKENYFTYLLNPKEINEKRDPGLVPAIAPRENKYFINDKFIKITKKADKEKFTKMDIIYFNNSILKITNSVVFYMNNIYKKQCFFKFDTKLKNERPITVK
jgi:hypothetical protein